MKRTLLFTKSESRNKLALTYINFLEMHLKKGKVENIMPFSIMYKTIIRNSGKLVTYNEHINSFDAMTYFDPATVSHKNKPLRHIPLIEAKIIFDSCTEVEIIANYKSEEDFELLLIADTRQ